MLHTKNKSGSFSLFSSNSSCFVESPELTFPSHLFVVIAFLFSRTQPSPRSSHSRATRTRLRPTCSQGSDRSRRFELPRLLQALQRRSQHGCLHDGSFRAEGKDRCSRYDVQSVSLLQSTSDSLSLASFFPSYDIELTRPFVCSLSYPTLPISFVVSELAFEDAQEAAAFLAANNADRWVAPPAGGPRFPPVAERVWDCKASAAALVEAAQRNVKVDIKGQL